MVDILYVNRVPFLTSISNYIHYGSANTVDNMKADILEMGLKNLVQYYAIRGFLVVVILVDIQFKSLKDRNKVSIAINFVSKGEYIKK